MALQTIVSRENDPLEPAVVTVGSIHGGTKHNIIPDEVKLQITVRSYTEADAQKILAAIERIAKAEAAAAGAPKAAARDVGRGAHARLLQRPRADEAAWSAILTKQFGAPNVVELPPVMGARTSPSIGAPESPSVFFRLGEVAPAKFAAAGGDTTKLPSLHSSEFAPDPEPTLKTGAAALTLAAMELLGKP